MKKEAEAREAKLLEMQRLEEDDPIWAFMLKWELEHGCEFSLVKAVSEALSKEQE
ncbi:MAG: hypothetical protein ACYSTF_09025 [Planctomycetota bacterium]|jgi:hypothetical protein